MVREEVEQKYMYLGYEPWEIKIVYIYIDGYFYGYDEKAEGGES